MSKDELDFQVATHHPPTSLMKSEQHNEKEAQAVMRAFTRGLVGTEDWQRVVRNAVKSAERGDANARNFLADYLLGRPGEKLEIDVGKNLADMMRKSLEAGE